MSLLPIDRRGFLNELETVIYRAKLNNREAGLVLLDISNLPDINLEGGYSLGDNVIASVSSALADLATRPKMFFRISGHTFAFLLDGLSTPALLVVAVNRLRTAAASALGGHESTIAPRLSIGVATTHANKVGARGLLANADLNLGESKAGAVFDPERILQPMHGESADAAITAEFEQAMGRNEFELFYQPQMHIASGKIVGAEALLRWRHSTLGFISPEQLIAMADGMSRSFELTRGVVQMGIRNFASWHATYPDLKLALNISAELISHGDLPDLLNSAIKIWGVQASAVVVEMTEQAVVQDIEVGAHALEAMRAAGFGVSIDDFGTGYSSLSYFRDIPANELKIDRSFVSRLRRSHQDYQLVRIIIDIAHLFGMQVVAEGVEDVETLAALQKMGCDIVQGYFIAKPMAAPVFDTWLEERPGLQAFPGDIADTAHSTPVADYLYR